MLGHPKVELPTPIFEDKASAIASAVIVLVPGMVLIGKPTKPMWLSFSRTSKRSENTFQDTGNENHIVP